MSSSPETASISMTPLTPKASGDVARIWNFRWIHHGFGGISAQVKSIPCV